MLNFITALVGDYQTNWKINRLFLITKIKDFKDTTMGKRIKEKSNTLKNCFFYMVYHLAFPKTARTFNSNEVG